MCNSSIFLFFFASQLFFHPFLNPNLLEYSKRSKKNVQHQQKFVAVQNEVRMNHLFILRSILFLVKASKSVSKRYTEWVNRWGKIHQIARNSTAKNFIFLTLHHSECWNVIKHFHVRFYSFPPPLPFIFRIMLSAHWSCVCGCIFIWDYESETEYPPYITSKMHCFFSMLSNHGGK